MDMLPQSGLKEWVQEMRSLTMKNQDELLQEVADTLNTRGAIYGSAHTNHRRISELWSGYLDSYISPEQVAMCMLLVKVSRLSESATHEDSLKDLLGYGLVYHRIIREMMDDNVI